MLGWIFSIFYHLPSAGRLGDGLAGGLGLQDQTLLLEDTEAEVHTAPLYSAHDIAQKFFVLQYRIQNGSVLFRIENKPVICILLNNLQQKKELQSFSQKFIFYGMSMIYFVRARPLKSLCHKL